MGLKLSHTVFTHPDDFKKHKNYLWLVFLCLVLNITISYILCLTNFLCYVVVYIRLATFFGENSCQTMNNNRTHENFTWKTINWTIVKAVSQVVFILDVCCTKIRGNQNLKNSKVRNVSFKEVKLATKLVWSFTSHGRRCTVVEQMLGVCPHYLNSHSWTFWKCRQNYRRWTCAP